MNKWFLAYKEHQDNLFDLSDLTLIEPPSGRYYADPFLFEHNGRTYVFFEDYDYKKGTIAVSELLNWEPKAIVSEDFHLSFPHVFIYKDDVYIIPESGINGDIRLYKCVDFPYVWEFDRVLYEGGGNFADTIFHQDASGCYLFTTVSNDNVLTILRSDSLHGPWKPFKTREAQDMRNAGAIFKYNGHLLRPVQNCQPHYGNGIIFRDLQIDPFSEIEKRRIDPDWMDGLKGTHTFNSTDKYLIIDGKIEV